MQPESTMLRFIQLLPDASPIGDFLLKDLPGSGKRIDILCRDLAACFSWSPMTWPKENLELVAVIADSRILTFRNPEEETPQSEVEWATVVSSSLKEQPLDYVTVSEGSLEDIINQYNTQPKSTLWVLEESGTHISILGPKLSTTQNSFMLGDHRGFNSQTESLLSRYSLPRVSLGKKSYLSSHCVASIISEFERSQHAQ
jgi:tRNA (pseudouridine54-N1)-methyltransferase